MSRTRAIKVTLLLAILVGSLGAAALALHRALAAGRLAQRDPAAALAQHDMLLALLAAAVLITVLLGLAAFALVSAHRAHTARRQAWDKLRTIVERSPVGIAFVAPHPPWRVLTGNVAFAELLGCTEDELPGEALWTLLPSADANATRVQLDRLMDETDELRELELRLGHSTWVSVTASPVRDPEGLLEQFVLQVADISIRKQHERELELAAAHDPLTGLLNRRRFDEELRRVAAECARYGTATSVLLCDLDGLKQVNDTLGHEAGDAVILAVARALRHGLREPDVIARLGGDEFAVLLSHTDTEDALAVAERLRAAVLALGAVIDTPGLAPSLSIGVAPMLPGAGPRESLAAADAALYEAKRGGRNRVALRDHAVAQADSVC